jgi:hypothetical protein
MALAWAPSPTIMHLEDDVGPAGHHTTGWTALHATNSVA